MIAEKYAILSTCKKDYLNDLMDGYNREFERHAATIIDYEELYLRYGNRKTEEMIKNLLDEKKIEVLIYHSGITDFHFSIEFFLYLRSKVYLVMTSGDSEYYFNYRDIYYAQCFDLVVVYDCLSRYRFASYGIDAISFYSSFDASRYRRLKHIEEDIDVSFVGDMRNKMDRIDYLNYLGKNGIEVKIFGAGTRGGQLGLEEMVQIFNRTRINLNFTGISEKNAFGKEPAIDLRLKQIKGRIAEIALSGGFVLTEYVPGIEEVFQPGREVAVFHTKDELMASIRYYLDNERERREIGERGHMRALRDYEIGSAIPRLISRIEAFRRQNVRPEIKVYLDERFIKCYATFRAGMMAAFIKRRRWREAFEEFLIILRAGKIDVRKASGMLLFGLFPKLKTGYVRLRYGIEH